MLSDFSASFSPVSPRRKAAMPAASKGSTFLATNPPTSPARTSPVPPTVRIGSPRSFHLLLLSREMISSVRPFFKIVAFKFFGKRLNSLA